MRVAFFTAFYSTPGLGPMRMAQYFREYKGTHLKFTFFSDDQTLGLPNEVIAKKISWMSKLPGYWLVRSWRFFHAFKKGNMDFDTIICSNAFEAFFFSMLRLNIPLIVMLNDDNSLYAHHHFMQSWKKSNLRKATSRWLGFYIERFVARKASAVFACSHYLKESIIKSYNLSDEKVKVLYPAVDTAFFHLPRNPSESSITVFFMKSDWKRGGLETLITALAITDFPKPLVLILAGIPKADYKKVLQLMEEHKFKGQVELVGLLSIEEVRTVFLKSDLFVLPSLQEGFGISILEAMATRTPVIAANVGGIPECLNRGNAGFLVQPNNPREIKETINTILKNSEIVKEKVSFGGDFVDQFDKKKLYSNLEGLLFSLNR